MNKNKVIPKFKNYDEESVFWDTHEALDYVDRNKKIKVVVSSNMTKSVNVRLDKDTISEIEKNARSIGVRPSTLVRMIVKEHYNTGK